MQRHIHPAARGASILVVTLSALLTHTSRGHAEPLEWVGFEISAPAVGVSSGDDVVNFGAGLAVRVATIHRGALYWTPVEAGLGLFMTRRAFGGGDIGASHVFATTQLGFRTHLGGPHQLDLGLGVGLGIVATPTSDAQDGDSAGGGGIMLVPTARYVHQTASPWAIGASLRVLTPTSGRDGAFGGAVLLSFDVAAIRHSSKRADQARRAVAGR